MTDSPDNHSTDRFVMQLTKHRHSLYAFIAKQVINPTDAEDIFQKTTVVLWRKMDQFDESGSFFHWACGIAFNEIRNFLKTRNRSRLHFDIDLITLIAEEAEEEETLSEARRTALGICLSKLPERQRQLLSRCYAGTDTISDVAESIGQNRSALYKQLARLKEKLLACVRQRLAIDGGNS